MENTKALNIYRQRRINLNDVLTWMFAFWPLFWNVSSVMIIPSSIAGFSIPVLLLFAMTAAKVIIYPRIKVSVILCWFVFFLIVFAESVTHLSAQAKSNYPVILFAILYCVMSYEKTINYQIFLRTVFICGLIISAFVIIDTATGVIRNELIWIFTESSQEAIQRHTVSGGILPYSASAGCFIYSGLAAYLTLSRIQEKKTGAVAWVILLLFLLAAVMIRKRGFVFDLIISVLAFRIMLIRKNDLKTLSVNRSLKRMLFLLLAVIAAIVLYYRLRIVRESVDSLLNRFFMEDETLSGRTVLYRLAFSLYRDSGRYLTGIGWGNYRLQTVGVFFSKSDLTYAVHNVYLQLLCETGILGLSAFLIAVIRTLVYGITKYRRAREETPNRPEVYVIGLGVFLQFFFLAYCMSGNPLYDYNFLITYFGGILLTLTPTIKGVSVSK